MRVRSTVGSTLLAGALATSLAACGGDSKGSSPGTTPAGVDLVMTGTSRITWEPDAASVAAGDVTIQLRNTSNLKHNLYIIAPDGTQNPGFLESDAMNDNPVETVTLAAGTYTIICKVPGHEAMKAALTVTG